MKCYKFGLCTCIWLVAFVLTFQTDAIHVSDFTAVQKFPALLLSVVPNPNPKHNVLLAPMAVRSSLLLASYAAKRQTKNELQTLSYEDKPEHLERNLKYLKDEDGWKVRIFVNDDPRTDVSMCIKKKFTDLIEYSDFSNRQKAEKQMFNWVSKRTNNFLPKFLSPNFPRPFVSLVHVEYFEANFTQHFPNVFKGKDSIVLENRTFSDTMHQTGNHLYGKLHKLGAEVIELELTNNARMLIFQPLQYKEEENFEALKRKLQNVDLTTISRNLTRTMINLFFPVITTAKMSRSFKDAAKQLGIHQPLQRQNANFDKLHSCGHESYMETLTHESKINIYTHSLQVATVVNIRMSFKDAISNTRINGDDEEIEEEEKEEPKRTGGRQAPITRVPNVALEHFIYVIIRDDVPRFMGTVVRYSNEE